MYSSSETRLDLELTTLFTETKEKLEEAKGLYEDIRSLADQYSAGILSHFKGGPERTASQQAEDAEEEAEALFKRAADQLEWLAAYFRLSQGNLEDDDLSLLKKPGRTWKWGEQVGRFNKKYPHLAGKFSWEVRETTEKHQLLYNYYRPDSDWDGERLSAYNMKSTCLEQMRAVRNVIYSANYRLGEIKSFLSQVEKTARPGNPQLEREEGMRKMVSEAEALAVRELEGYAADFPEHQVLLEASNHLERVKVEAGELGTDEAEQLMLATQARTRALRSAAGYRFGKAELEKIVELSTKLAEDLSQVELYKSYNGLEATLTQLLSEEDLNLKGAVSNICEALKGIDLQEDRDLED